MFRAFKIKAFTAFLLIHLGLVVSIYGIFRLEIPTAEKLPLWVGTALWYGGILLGAAWVYMPLAPFIRWARRIHSVLTWNKFLTEGIPLAIAAIPAIQAGLKAIRGAPNSKPTPAAARRMRSAGARSARSRRKRSAAGIQKIS